MYDKIHYKLKKKKMKKKKINPDTCYKADTLKLKNELSRAFFLFEARIGHVACRVTKCREGPEAAAAAFPWDNWSPNSSKKGPLCRHRHR